MGKFQGATMPTTPTGSRVTSTCTPCRSLILSRVSSQTTRTRVMGIRSTPEAQLVFVDTPGLHKPVTALGTKLNETANEALSGVDVVCLVIDCTKPFGTGDKWVASHLDMYGLEFDAGMAFIKRYVAAMEYTP